MLVLEQMQFEAVRRHGEETYPHECCGVLLGRAEDATTNVVEVVPASNTRTDSARNRYQIAPQELIRIQREARQKGLDIVGFYHSHPDHPALWSKTDLAEAHWFGCSYVITSVRGSAERCPGRGRATETHSFLLAGTNEEDKHFEDQPIEVAASVSVK